jgi:hypothetical protein
LCFDGHIANRVHQSALLLYYFDPARGFQQVYVQLEKTIAVGPRAVLHFIGEKLIYEDR